MEQLSGLPPLEALEAVLAAAREGSFSKAAEELGITHGAVSRRVALVETWIGQRIFERHGRGVRATPSCHAFLLQLERASAILHDSRSLVSTGASLETVRVGVVPSFARMWLFPHLAALEGTPADLRVEADVDERFMTLSEARVAIRYGTGDWPGVTSRPLFREWALPVASRAIAGELSSHDDPERLLAWPLLHDASAGNWIGWLGHSGVFYQPRQQDRFSFLSQAVRKSVRDHRPKPPFSRLHLINFSLHLTHRQRETGPTKCPIVLIVSQSNSPISIF